MFSNAFIIENFISIIKLNDQDEHRVQIKLSNYFLADTLIDYLAKFKPVIYF